MSRTREHQILATHLCSYITDRSAVAIHINRQFSTRYTSTDIERLTRAKPVFERLPIGREEAIGGKDYPIKAGHGKGYDPLALALFKYHAKRATANDREYWERLSA